MTELELLEFRSKHSQMYNDNKLKLGHFGGNVSTGIPITTASTFKLTLDQNVRIAQRLEQAGFEALVPVARWKGYGGSTNLHGDNWDTFIYAAAMASVTKKIQLFATNHVSTVHPIVAAKQATTIDHISSGRFGLNIVCGWYSPEMDMFGEKQRNHTDRYRHAQEWLDVVNHLWSVEGEFDHEGEFFKIIKGFHSPKPVDHVRPILINAGGSKEGRNFAARNCDFLFTFAPSYEAGEAVINNVKQMAWDHYKRELGYFTFASVYCRETEKEARDYYHYIVHEHGDWVAATNLCNEFGIQSESLGEELTNQLKELFVAGWGGFPLIGTPEQVTEQLLKISGAGFDGCLLSWADFDGDFDYFEQRVLPLMKQAGLRN